MFKKIFSTALILSASMAMAAGGGELDKDVANTNPVLKKNVVLRVDAKTKQVAFLETSQPLDNANAAAKLVQTKAGSFKNVPNKKLVSELDQDGPTQSWYFYNPWGYNNYYGGYYGNSYSYGYPSYCYNNYYYQPYYNYYYGGYNYYYYGYGFGRW